MNRTQTLRELILGYKKWRGYLQVQRCYMEELLGWTAFCWLPHPALLRL